ncbi:MAG: tRNA lysidine(34) synthetase TilS [Bacteroidales bacterium]|jgi:tRNA(Ile)-lysidine synthase|nr:tRNA lysidine(34) synthetase TilS [Bacteroidales bacterium]
MIKEFQKFITDNNLFSDDDTILLAVSGGIDSMVMCHLFKESGYKFAIAHCNFHLREEESNRDAEFVTKYAKENKIKLHKIDFDTYGYMHKNNKSLEMAARELRYNWFYSLLDEFNYAFVATGHHADDSIETFFINLIRGTGIAGLHGILEKVNRVIHPLLFTNRDEIKEYREQNNISFVEDSTNNENKYTRNRIRNQLIPLLKDISPSINRTILKEIERFKETEKIFRSIIDREKSNLIEREEGYIKISIEKLKKLEPINIYLYEILSEFDFNESSISSIKEAFDETSGKQFFSETHRLIKDRHYLLIAPIKKEGLVEEYSIQEEQTKLINPINIQIETLKDLSFIKIPKEKNIAMFDLDKLSFPLTLRKWRNGDAFFPYGMKTEKKISDFYRDLKYSLIDKETQWLLCSEGNIIWVVGQRIDERYKITNKTKNIYKLELDE